MKTIFACLLVGYFVLSSHPVTARTLSSTAFEALNIYEPLAFSFSNRQELKIKDRKQATVLVKSRYKGKVVSISASKVNGNPGYKAKLLGNDGTVFYVYIDATSGKMTRR